MKRIKPILVSVFTITLFLLFCSDFAYGQRPSRGNKGNTTGAKPNNTKPGAGNKRNQPNNKPGTGNKRNQPNNKPQNNRIDNQPGETTDTENMEEEENEGFSAYQITHLIVLNDSGKIVRGIIVAKGPKAIEIIDSTTNKSIILKQKDIKFIKEAPAKDENDEENNEDEKEVTPEVTTEEDGEEKEEKPLVDILDFVVEKDDDGLLKVAGQGFWVRKEATTTASRQSAPVANPFKIFRQNQQRFNHPGSS